jgi:hypothetical protein
MILIVEYPPLRHRLFYLNFRYLVNTFQKNGHPLRDKLEKLNDLRSVGWIFNVNTRHELGAILSTPEVNRHMEVALSGVHADMYPIVAPARGQASVFTANLAAIRMAMENEALGRYSILTYSMSSMYQCKQKCWQLTRRGREVSFMWVPAHVGIAGNEWADFKAKQAALGYMVYNVLYNRLLEICFQSQNRACWTNGRKIGKSLKK